MLWLMFLKFQASLGEWKEVFYTGKSLHPRADLSEVRGTKDDCCLLLLPSSKEPSFLWTLALVMALGSAASASCTLYHSPHKVNFGDQQALPYLSHIGKLPSSTEGQGHKGYG